MMEALVWARVPGDVVFSVGCNLFRGLYVSGVVLTAPRVLHRSAIYQGDCEVSRCIATRRTSADAGDARWRVRSTISHKLP